ncbi:MAG: helix-turn-helix domain-containing protein [Chlamydiota bacterium]
MFDNNTNLNEAIPIVELPTPQRKVISITEAARINNVTRQAIYVAIKQKKLKARKIETRWVIHVDDLAEYRNSKYSRTKSMHNGELLFDNNKGYYSINQVAKLVNVPPQKIYYATRVGHLKALRKGAAWVCQIEDIRQYQDNYLNKKSPFDEEFVI